MSFSVYNFRGSQTTDAFCYLRPFCQLGEDGDRLRLYRWSERRQPSLTRTHPTAQWYTLGTANSRHAQDQSFLKTPFELLRKNHKIAQRIVERESSSLLPTLKATANADASSSPSTSSANVGPTQTLSAIDTMIKRMENLKRKLATLQVEETMLHKQSRARLEHVQQLHEIKSVADVKYDEWSKVRLNRLLVDYLLRCGYTESAKNLAKAHGIEELVDIEASVAASKIIKSLEECRTSECLAWCADNKASLKKMNVSVCIDTVSHSCDDEASPGGSTMKMNTNAYQSDLEHELRMQEYIELLRAGSLLRGRAYAQKHLTTDRPEDIRAAGLLAYKPTTPIEPYRKMYSSGRWADLAALFRRTHHSLISVPDSPPLYIALSAGLSALKTPSCHSSHVSPSSALNATTSSPTGSNAGAAASRSATASSALPTASTLAISHAHASHSVCPICSTELNALARPVPYAHHAKSVVDPDLVVLPNGRVYGRERLMAFQGKVGGGGSHDSTAVGAGDRMDLGGDSGNQGDGWIRDPADPGQVFELGELRRVYIS